MIRHDNLLEVLNYDPSSGIFTWKQELSPVAPVGTLAGTLMPDDRRVIYIHRKRYAAGRLAWFYMTGLWPSHEIDHKNRVASDDRYENLREASPTQNTRNKRLYKNNKSGFKGVFQRESGKYRAMIRVEKVLRHLGTFARASDAARAYDAAATVIFGEFASPNYMLLQSTGSEATD